MQIAKFDVVVSEDCYFDIFFCELLFSGMNNMKKWKKNCSHWIVLKIINYESDINFLASDMKKEYFF